MNNEYVNALIQMPIKVLEDDSFEIMSEYMTIQINHCSELPEKRDMLSLQMSLHEQIKKALEEKRFKKKHTILPREKLPKKRPQNITFKQYSNNKSALRNTAKNYNDDSDSEQDKQLSNTLIEEENKHLSNTLIEEENKQLSNTLIEEENKQLSNPLMQEDKQLSNPLMQEDKQLSNPLMQEDMDADVSQQQVVQESKPVIDL
jgi:hypothetical protein